ncbi:hypothetical protein [Peribacillus simplex]|uniref:hypothetical protein n=1 Tax=Peribacillus simplex TaxID=1478 RepID=UPI003D2DA053
MIEKVGKPEAVAADAASKTPAITSYLFGKEITLVVHSTRTKGNFKRGSGSFHSEPLLSTN